MNLHRRQLLLTPLLLALAGPAAALQLAGVGIPESVEQDGITLLRNGAGVRRFLLFNVYVAALYLERPATQPQPIVNMPGPKLLRLVLLRDLPATELLERLESGMRANVEAELLAQLQPETERLRQRFTSHPPLRRGQVVDLRWLPQQGTLISVDQQPLGSAEPDPRLYQALLQVWLGPQPADSRLKQALLGAAI